MEAQGPIQFILSENGILSYFKKMIHDPSTSRLSLEATSFLSKKGFFESMEEFSFLRLYGFHGKPFCYHFMFLIYFSSLKYVYNTSVGHISSMRKGKRNVAHCHGKLERCV
jgi:hypothetical protein